MVRYVTELIGTFFSRLHHRHDRSRPVWVSHPSRLAQHSLP